jgi:SAM-dependent methyltransferase
VANNVWDAADYDTRFGFVTRSGDDLIDALDPGPGQQILDLGCGPGRHSAQMSQRGADVVGLDLDPDMLAKARADHPGVDFVSADAASFTLADLGRDRPFDGCLSNAALHWMNPQVQVLGNVRAVLRGGARFVAEMGGAGNIATLDRALVSALAGLGIEGVEPPGTHFPTLAEQAGNLEAAGFRVEWAHWFPRPTPLEPGSTPADWVRHFRAPAWAAVPADLRGEFADLIDRYCEAHGLRSDSGWVADYCRLRFIAVADASGA